MCIRDRYGLRAPSSPGKARAGSQQREQQMLEKGGGPRRERVRLCLGGGCGETNEEPMVCRGLFEGAPCTARLHGRRCAQLPKGHAVLGCFLCPECRMRAMNPGQAVGDMPMAAREMCETAMLTEMSSGAEATGASFADFKKLELKNLMLS